MLWVAYDRGQINKEFVGFGFLVGRVGDLNCDGVGIAFCADLGELIEVGCCYM